MAVATNEDPVMDVEIKGYETYAHLGPSVLNSLQFTIK